MERHRTRTVAVGLRPSSSLSGLLLPLWPGLSPTPAPWLYDATCSHTGHPILSSAQADLPPVWSSTHSLHLRAGSQGALHLQGQRLTPALRFLSTNCPTISWLQFFSSQNNEDWEHVIVILQLPWSQGSGNCRHKEGV